jgi:TolB-like protein
VGTTALGRPGRAKLASIAAALVLVGAVFLVWRSLQPHTSDAVPIHSIAVLPFANASKDPEMDYLGDGISEEITNSLSRLPNLKVMARSTVSHYKSRQDDPQGVGRALHVDAVLTGRVAEHGNQLDVETELVDVTTGAQLWGRRYTRIAADVSQLQAAIVSDAASQLRPQLGGTEREKLANVETSDAEAYQLYLKGRYHFDRYTKEDFQAAVGFFEKAVLRDPNYAAAYAGLADAYTQQGYYGYLPGGEAFDKSRDAARRAMHLDNKIPEPHLSLAASDLFFFRNFVEAETEIQKALDLDRNSAYAHEVNCWFQGEVGRVSEAVAECRRAAELDPLSPIYNFGLSNIYYLARDYDRSIDQANKTLEIDPRFPLAIAEIGWDQEQKGNYRDAVEQWIRNAQVQGDEARANGLRRAFEKSGYPGFLRKDAEYKKADGEYDDAASDFAMLGEKDAAFSALERALFSGQGIDEFKLDPSFDNLRSDPRYPDLLRRLGLPQ